MVIITTGTDYAIKFYATGDATYAAPNSIGTVTFDPTKLALVSVTSNKAGGAQNGTNPNQYDFGTLLPNEVIEVVWTFTVLQQVHDLTIDWYISTTETETTLADNGATKNLLTELGGILCADVNACVAGLNTTHPIVEEVTVLSTFDPVTHVVGYTQITPEATYISTGAEWVKVPDFNAMTFVEDRGVAVPNTLTDPTGVATPEEGDSVQQRYTDGLVLSVYQGGNWINTLVSTATGAFSIVTNVVAGHPILTHTSGDGTITVVNETVTSINYDPATGIFTFRDENGVNNPVTFPIEDFLTSGTYDANTEELVLTLLSGDTVTIDLQDLVSDYIIIDNGNGTYNLRNVTTGLNVGATIDTNSVITNIIAGNRIATHISAGGTVRDISETITTLTAVLNQSVPGAPTIDITYTNEGNTNAVQSIPLAGALNDTDTTYTITNFGGGVLRLIGSDGSTSDVNICDLIANCTTLDATISYDDDNNTITYTAPSGDVTSLDLNEVVVDNLQGGKTIATVRNEIGTAFDIKETVTTLSAVLNQSVPGNPTLDITYINEDGSNGVTVVPLAGVASNITYSISDIGGGELRLTGSDGSIDDVDICALIASCTTLDGDIEYNDNNNSITYTAASGAMKVLDLNEVVVTNLQAAGKTIANVINEVGTSFEVKETITTLTAVLNQAVPAAPTIDITYVNEDGSNTVQSIPLGPLLDDTDTTYTLAEGNGSFLNLVSSTGVISSVDICNLVDGCTGFDGSLAYSQGLNRLIYTSASGVQTPLDLNNVEVTNLQPTGNIIGKVINEVGQDYDVRETVTTLTAELDNTNIENPTLVITYANEDGTNVTQNVNLAAVLDGVTYHIDDNSNGTITLVGSDGSTDDVDICGIVQANCPENVTEISYSAGLHRIVYVDEDNNTTNLDLNKILVSNVQATGKIIATITDEVGAATNVRETVTTIDAQIINPNSANPLLRIIYTNEDGTNADIDVNLNPLLDNVGYTLEDRGNGVVALVGEDGNTDIVNICDIIARDCPQVVTSISYNSALNEINYVDEDGNTTQLFLKEVLVSNLISGNRIATILNELGNQFDIDETITSLSYSGTTGDLTYIDETGSPNTINIAVDNFLQTAVYDNTDNELTLTLTNGMTFTIDLADLVSQYNLVNNGDGTYNLHDDVGIVGSTIDTNSMVSNTIAGNRIATHTSAGGTLQDIDETVTTFAANLDVTNPASPILVLNYQNEGGSNVVQNIDLTDLVTEENVSYALSNPLNTSIVRLSGTDGSVNDIDICTIIQAQCPENLTTIAYSPTTNKITYTDEAGNDTELDLKEILVENLIAGNRIATITDELGNPFDIDETITSATYDAGLHVITYTKEGGGTDVITLDNPTLTFVPATNTLTHTAPDGTVTPIVLPFTTETVTLTSSTGITPTTNPPLNPIEGDEFINRTDNIQWIHNGNNWFERPKDDPSNLISHNTGNLIATHDNGLNLGMGQIIREINETITILAAEIVNTDPANPELILRYTREGGDMQVITVDLITYFEKVHTYSDPGRNPITTVVILDPIIGDEFINTGDGKQFIYDGTEWVERPLVEQEVVTTTAITGQTPTTAPPADPNEGDTFVNTIDETEFIYDDADGWVEIVNGRESVTVTSIIGESPTTNPPANPKEGDTFVNTNVTTPAEFIYDGANWISVVNEREDVTITGVAGQTPTTNPPVLPKDGDTFVNTTDKTEFIYDGTQWVEIEKPAETVTINTVAGQTPITNPPADPEEGDTFVNTTDDTEFIYDGAAWVEIRNCCESVTTSAVADSTPATDPPTDPKQGDEFINTLDETSWVYDGTVWVQRHPHQTNSRVLNYTGDIVNPPLADFPNTTPVAGDITVFRSGLVRDQQRAFFWEETVGRWLPYYILQHHTIDNIVADWDFTNTQLPTSPGYESGDTASIKFTNDIVAHYTYDGDLAEWTFNYISHIGDSSETVTVSTVATETPTTVPPTDPKEGDTFVNTTDNTEFIYDGTNWIEIKSCCESVTVSAVADETPTTNPPTNPSEGDEFINTLDETSWVYDGTSWVQRHPLQTTTFEGISFPSSGTFADPDQSAFSNTTPIVGDITSVEKENGKIRSFFYGSQGGVSEWRPYYTLQEHAFRDNQSITYTGVEIPPADGNDKGDTSQIKYSGGEIVCYTWTGAAWTVDYIIEPGAEDGEVQQQDNTGNDIPAVLVDPTVITTPIAGDAVFQIYDDGTVISTYDGTNWTNTALTAAAVGDGETTIQNNGATDIPTVLVDPTAIATPIAGDAVVQIYQDGIVFSTHDGTNWTNATISRCSSSRKFKTITAAYTVLPTDGIIYIDNSAAAINVTLDPTTLTNGSCTTVVDLKVIGADPATNAVTLTAASGVIFDNVGAATFTYANLGESVKISSDGTNLYIL